MVLQITPQSYRCHVICVCLYFHLTLGMGALDGFLGCSIHAPLIQHLHFVSYNCVKGGHISVLELWLWINRGIFTVDYFCSCKSQFLCQSHFMEIITLSQG